MAKVPINFQVAHRTNPHHDIRLGFINVKLAVLPFVNINGQIAIGQTDWMTVQEQVALVDTGADISVIDPDATDLSNANFLGNVNSSTTTTENEEPCYILQMRAEGYDFEFNLRFIVKRFAASSVQRVILGMEFIRFGQLVIEGGGNNGWIDFP